MPVEIQHSPVMTHFVLNVGQPPAAAVQMLLCALAGLPLHYSFLSAILHLSPFWP